MKPEKYYLMSDSANYRASRRLGIAELTRTQLRYLYSLRRLGETSQLALTDYVYSHRPHVVRPDNRSSWNTLNSLVIIGLVDKTSRGHYAISSMGREYLSYLRNYLVNKRL